MSTEQPTTTRRHFLTQAGAGLGSIALACMLNENAMASSREGAAAIERLHYPPKVKRVIQIFCCGGVSHIDTFDHKPELIKRDGQDLGKKFDTFFGQPGRIMKSPFEFKQYGQTGHWCSNLVSNIGGCVDDITFLQSMVSKSSNHTPATFFMNSGFTLNGFPSLGAWLSYGLGTDNQDLPAFVVLPDPRGNPAGGSINWSSGFLPATHQGVAFSTKGDPIPALFPPKEIAHDDRQAGLSYLEKLNADYVAQHPGESAIAARIRAYELAGRMQTSIPETVRFDAEPEHIQKLYGLDNPITEGFGKNCLLARRLVERGVRFVQLFNGGAFGSPRINWDAHEDLVENHTKQAGVMDKPVAGLLKDLKQRGMLQDTLLLWTTEFGRTPITQGIGAKGRDHHPGVFTVWMAGAGLKPGYRYGASDDAGYAPATAPTTVYDLHTTVLRLLGIDHKRLTYYHNGIRRRLTDVHGEVIEGVLA